MGGKRGDFMRLTFRFILVLICNILISCSFNPIDYVKNGTLDIDKSAKVGNVLESYKYFSDIRWDKYQDQQKRNIVIFTANINLEKLFSDYDNSDVGEDFNKVKLGDVVDRMDFDLHKSSRISIQFLINADEKGFNLGSVAVYINDKNIYCDNYVMKSIYSNVGINCLYSKYRDYKLLYLTEKRRLEEERIRIEKERLANLEWKRLNDLKDISKDIKKGLSIFTKTFKYSGPKIRVDHGVLENEIDVAHCELNIISITDIEIIYNMALTIKYKDRNIQPYSVELENSSIPAEIVYFWFNEFDYPNNTTDITWSLSGHNTYSLPKTLTPTEHYSQYKRMNIFHRNGRPEMDLYVTIKAPNGNWVRINLLLI